MIDPSVPEYSRAWVAYQRRWLAAWVIPLILVICYVASGFRTVLLVIAFGAYVVFYLRFIYWPCPRCGKRFTMAEAHRIVRAEKCIYCGLSMRRPRPGDGL